MLCVALTTWHSHQCSISHGLKEKNTIFQMSKRTTLTRFDRELLEGREYSKLQVN